jgi:2-iminobutanoate/2-iminopropanoate deaminase
LTAGLLGAAGAGAAAAHTESSYSPKKQIIGLKPGEVRRGALLSGAVRSGHLIFLSGTGGWYPNRRKEPGDAKVQIRSVLETMKAKLEAAGSSLDNLLQVTICLSDMKNNYEPMNEAYKEYFPTNPPARSCFPGGPFRREGSLLQVDAVAYVD